MSQSGWLDPKIQRNLLIPRSFCSFCESPQSAFHRKPDKKAHFQGSLWAPGTDEAPIGFEVHQDPLFPAALRGVKPSAAVLSVVKRLGYAVAPGQDSKGGSVMFFAFFL